MNFKKLKLHQLIMISMVLGFVFGYLINMYQKNFSAELMSNFFWWTKLLGKDLFIGSLKMIIAPLIFASIVTGICSLPDMKKLGDIGGKTFFYYAASTTVAVGIGLIAVLVIKPGKLGGSIELRENRIKEINTIKSEFNSVDGAENFSSYLSLKSGGAASEANEKKWKTIKKGAKRDLRDMLREDILLKFLKNPIDSLANTNSLGIIFFAILVGLACLILGEQASSVSSFFTGLNEVMNKITMWVMRISPVAIFCLIANMMASQGIAALNSLLWYCLTVIVGIFCHIIFLLLLVQVLGRKNPLEFLKGIREAWLIAFSTTSSAATLPVTMNCVEKNLGVDKKVSNFALPVGATCNMDGTALYEGVAIIFMIQIFGGLADVPINLDFGTTFVIFITAVIASVGAAAVPSAGLITMAIVANAVGLPLYYIPILYSVDHFLDQFRTSTNVLGDAAGCVIVDRFSKK
tara:strand:+ start:3214 stop:4602 length:1389 start_codon:yes stop_codon:yes gene_type:complete